MFDVAYKLMLTTDYATLMKHCQKEFLMENILFITIMIEWQDYLIHNQYWNEENNPLCRQVTCQYIENQQRIILPKTVPISPIISNITHIYGNKTHELDIKIQIASAVKDPNDRDKQQQSAPKLTAVHTESTTVGQTIVIVNSTSEKLSNNRYDKFTDCYEQIYTQYIQRGKAPLELNISSDLRDKMQAHYDNIKINGNKLNQNTFWEIWFDLTIVCNQVFDMLMPVLARCYKDMKVNTM